MLDLNNRKYKSIEFFVSGELVCFEMENGLSYSVLLQKKEIIVCVYADSVLKYFDSVEPGNLISKEELDKAVAILKTALLPTYSNAKLKRKNIGIVLCTYVYACARGDCKKTLVPEVTNWEMVENFCNDCPHKFE